VYESYEDEVEKTSAQLEADDVDWGAFDRCLSAEVVSPHGDEEALGVVVGRKRDADGNLVGTSRSNPFEDTAVYEVQFGDGSVQEYAANIIAANLYDQVDDEGNRI